MYTLYMAGLDYYHGRVGAIGPISDYGGARLNVAEELTKIIPTRPSPRGSSSS